MAIDRRRRALLYAAAGSCIGGLAVMGRTTGASELTRPIQASSGAVGDKRWPALIGAWSDQGAHHVGVWTSSAGATPRARLPGRAHGIVIDPSRPHTVIVVARRPGDFLLRLDVRTGERLQFEETEADRAFNGHAAHSLDGAVLYTSENDAFDGLGWIGVRDADTLRLRTQIATRGIGPHALLIEPDGNLLVANGGVLTLAESGRTKLDARLDSSLVRIDPRTGKLRGQWRLSDPSLSIRHLARAASGIVGIALQSEHPAAAVRQASPVLALFDGETIRAIAPVQTGDAKAKGGRASFGTSQGAGCACGSGDLGCACGSGDFVCACGSGDFGGYGGDIACVPQGSRTCFAVSCPRAGLVALWDEDGRWHGKIPVAHVNGLVLHGDSLIAASEDGEIAFANVMQSSVVQSKQNCVRRASGVQWDNHIAALTMT